MAVNEWGDTVSFLTWSRSSVRMGEGKGGNWAAGMPLAPVLVCSSCTLMLRGFYYFDFLSSLTLLQMKSGRKEGNFTVDSLPLLGLWTEGNGRISQLVCPFDSFLCWPSGYEWLFSCRHQLPGRFLLLLTVFRKKRSTYHSSVVTLPLSSTHLPHLPFFPFPSSSLRGLRVHMAVFLSFSSPLRHHFLREDSVGLHLSGPCVSLYHTTLISHNTSCLWVFLCLSSSPSGTCTHRRIEPISWLVQQCIPSANFFCKELDSK